MNQIKLLVLGVITTASLNINADVMSGYMDLSNLYGNTNAGQYFVGLALNIAKSAPVTYTQSLGDPQHSDQPGSEPQVCITEFRLNVGDAKLILTDANRDESITELVPLSWVASHADESEKCTPVEQLVKGELYFAAHIHFGSIALNYKAPFNYEKMYTAITVFPYGYSVKLNITDKSADTFTIGNLRQQFTAQLQRGNKKALQYYNYATQDQTSLSLGQGQIELK